jgi:hypothetical protein
MAAASITAGATGDNGLRGFQQLVVDAVELAGSLSPPLKTQLLSILGPTFPAEILPTINQKEASFPALLRMLIFARNEADHIAALTAARHPLDTCVAIVIDHASYRQFSLTTRVH